MVLQCRWATFNTGWGGGGWQLDQNGAWPGTPNPAHSPAWASLYISQADCGERVSLCEEDAFWAWRWGSVAGARRPAPRGRGLADTQENNQKKFPIFVLEF